MARTNVPTQEVPGTATTLGVVLTWTACDAVNGNFYYFKGRELILVKNDGVVSRTLTVVGRPDLQGRTADCTLTLAAGASGMIGPLQLVGWRSDTGQIEFDGDHADLKVAIIEV